MKERFQCVLLKRREYLLKSSYALYSSFKSCFTNIYIKPVQTCGRKYLALLVEQILVSPDLYSKVLLVNVFVKVVTSAETSRKCDR